MKRSRRVVLTLMGSAAIGAVWLGRRLVARFGGWSAALIAVAAYVLVVAAAMLILPAVTEAPDGFPADGLYEFRLYSVGTQLVMWATIAVVFASLTAGTFDETSPSGRQPMRKRA